MTSVCCAHAFCSVPLLTFLIVDLHPVFARLKSFAGLSIASSLLQDHLLLHHTLYWRAFVFPQWYVEAPNAKSIGILGRLEAYMGELMLVKEQSIADASLRSYLLLEFFRAHRLRNPTQRRTRPSSPPWIPCSQPPNYCSVSHSSEKWPGHARCSLIHFAVAPRTAAHASEITIQQIDYNIDTQPLRYFSNPASLRVRPHT